MARTRRTAPPTRRPAVRLSIALAASAWAASCATIDFDHPKEESFAFEDTSETTLARALERLPELRDEAARSSDGSDGSEGSGDTGPTGGTGSTPRPERLAGFNLLDEGIEALAARLMLARQAERSIDAQYYLITDDLTGVAFLRELVAAADRGVRVRLLIDDIQTAGYDAGMWLLDEHPNMEIRVFNPFVRGAFARLNAARSFARVNRRMHNKSFTVDNQLTIIGGRNIADEYFGARDDVNFGDLDLLCAGRIVGEVSELFDTYWNHPLAVPVPDFIDPPRDLEAARERLQARMESNAEELARSKYKRALDHHIDDWIHTNEDPFTWAPYALVYDSPDKARVRRTGEERSIVTPLKLALESAQDDFLLVSPYFVPGHRGIEFLGGLVENGLSVRVITNSLSANNHSVVHSGYAPSRIPLLERGVEIYEARADIGPDGALAAQSTLHTKAFVIDRQRIFVGSFNMDPRSANINTEMGVILDSPEIATGAVREVEVALPERSYRVYLDEHERLRWSTWENGEQLVYKREPETTFWTRFWTITMGVFPIHAQL